MFATNRPKANRARVSIRWFHLWCAPVPDLENAAAHRAFHRNLRWLLVRPPARRYSKASLRDCPRSRFLGVLSCDGSEGKRPWRSSTTPLNLSTLSALRCAPAFFLSLSSTRLTNGVLHQLPCTFCS